MKKIVKFLQVSFFLSILIFLNSETSYAACNFGNLKIGDDVGKVEALYGILPEGTTDGKIQVFPEDVCEGENLDDVIIEIVIYNNTISGFILIFILKLSRFIFPDFWSVSVGFAYF